MKQLRNVATLPLLYIINLVIFQRCYHQLIDNRIQQQLHDLHVHCGLSSFTWFPTKEHAKTKIQNRIPSFDLAEAPPGEGRIIQPMKTQVIR